jgi:hypothetical protein
MVAWAGFVYGRYLRRQSAVKLILRITLRMFSNGIYHYGGPAGYGKDRGRVNAG